MLEHLKKLPQINSLLQEDIFKDYNQKILKKITQKYIQNLREKILNSSILTPSYQDICQNIQNLYLNATNSNLKPLINATGIVTQTNLGRSIFSPELLSQISPLLCEYNNLEYDLEKGTRGERYSHVKNLICALFDCEDALVVNNNASAVLLIINTFAKNKEVIVSRGELIEIGGSFRIPEVIISAGGSLKEIGSTNKTHLKDYQNAINENTSIIFKAHKSNFKQVGFTKEVDFKELVKLAQDNNIIDYYDVGSGYISGIQDISEPSLLEISTLKPSLVSFSGDKLLGGPQAGIIFGKKHLIEKLKTNHLLRALRIDKFNILALNAILQAYIKEDFSVIPTINMLNQDLNALHQKALNLAEFLKDIPLLKINITRTQAKAGGGSLPDKDFPSYGLYLSHPNYKTQELNDKIRQKGLIARIQNDMIILDIFCIKNSHFKKIQTIFHEILT